MYTSIIVFSDTVQTPFTILLTEFINILALLRWFLIYFKTIKNILLMVININLIYDTLKIIDFFVCVFWDISEYFIFIKTSSYPFWYSNSSNIKKGNKDKFT